MEYATAATATTCHPAAMPVAARRRIPAAAASVVPGLRRPGLRPFGVAPPV